MKWTHILAIVGVFLAACGDPAAVVEEPTRNMQSISGTVDFAERIGLTADSRLELRLLDVSAADSAVTEIASRVIEEPGQSPLSFTIDFDANLIDQDSAYGVSAKIFDRDKLILVSDAVHPVLTRGAGNEITITAVRVSSTDRGN